MRALGSIHGPTCQCLQCDYNRKADVGLRDNGLENSCLQDRDSGERLLRLFHQGKCVTNLYKSFRLQNVPEALEVRWDKITTELVVEEDKEKPTTDADGTFTGLLTSSPEAVSRGAEARIRAEKGFVGHVSSVVDVSQCMQVL